MAKYESSWLRLKSWCQNRSPPYPYLPANPLHVAMFLQSELERAQKAGLQYGIIKSASGAIFCMHNLAGITPNPTENGQVALVRQGAARVLGKAPVNRKEPLDLLSIKALAAQWSGPTAPLWQLSLAAFAMTAFTGFLRFSDAAVILVKDVKFCTCEDVQYMAIFLSKRKNDQFREGNIIYIVKGLSQQCPLTLVRRLIDSAKLQESAPLFQGFDGWHPERGLNGRAIAYPQLRDHLVEGLSDVLDMESVEVKKFFGTHSLRSGGATLAARKLVPERLFQQHGGWKSKKAMFAYIKEAVDVKLSVTSALGY